MGIVGTGTKNFDSGLKSMLFSLSKRGPDDHGALRFPSCALGQTRLSILDISGGKQPMKDNAKNFAVTFNGEIYNYLELRSELAKVGHKFSTKSDTEVILKAYLEYGTDCSKYLEGMFAFAVWDEDRKMLFAARDRFGEKPFYYAFDNAGNFIFASEIKAILASGKIKGEIDPEAIDAYLSLMYIPPNRTVYKNIHVLPPASSLLFKNGTLEIKKYWSLDKKPIAMPYDEAKKEVKRLLYESIKKTMVADVEVGTFLSGGVDSTLVSYFAQQTSSFPIKTFSIGYENYINELPFALEASQKIGSDHYTMQAKGDMFDELVAVIKYFDEPHGDSADLAQHLVSKLAASKVKVALTGDGADELFMGYGCYFKRWNWSLRKNPMEKLFPHPFKDYINYTQIFSPREKKSLWKQYIPGTEYISKEIRNAILSPEEKINLYDITLNFPGQLLSKVDRMSMMHSLETRSPFLDKKLAEFVYSIPTEYKVDKRKGKIILKDILSDIMSPEFANRKKQGFNAPVIEWLRNETFKTRISHLFLKNDARIYSFFNEDYIKKMIRSFYKGDNSNFYKIWTLLCLELWFENHT
jgi:asparagine synthase (glutamine-hydrolysing)